MQKICVQGSYRTGRFVCCQLLFGLKIVVVSIVKYDMQKCVHLVYIDIGKNIFDLSIFFMAQCLLTYSRRGATGLSLSRLLSGLFLLSRAEEFVQVKKKRAKTVTEFNWNHKCSRSKRFIQIFYKQKSSKFVGLLQNSKPFSF